MKSLEKEAIEWYSNAKIFDTGALNAFIAGANSKWVKAEKIKAQIEVLESHIEHPRKPGYKRHDVIDTIKELNKRLKELEDESKTDIKA